VWLQYQSLWDMESGNIYSRLDINLGRWQKLLLDIKKSRKTIDNTETMKKFGPVEIHYGKVLLSGYIIAEDNPLFDSIVLCKERI
jgi:dynein heavy chain 1